jgi:hypothetical protein
MLRERSVVYDPEEVSLLGARLRSSDWVITGADADALQSNGNCKKHPGSCCDW